MRCKLFDCTMMKHIRDNAETSIRNAVYLTAPPENSQIRIISTALKNLEP